MLKNIYVCSGGGGPGNVLAFGKGARALPLLVAVEVGPRAIVGLS